MIYFITYTYTYTHIHTMQAIFKHIWSNVDQQMQPSEQRIFSATKFRNSLLKDPILDFLNLHGEKYGFQKDESNDSYDEYIMNRGNEFEAYIIESLSEKFKQFSFIDVGHKYERFNDDGVEETINHMKNGVDIIYQGYLSDKDLCIYGIPDLMIRIDKIKELFSIHSDFDISRLRLNKSFEYSYVIVDIKLSTIKFGKKGKVKSDENIRIYKSQLFIYNKILNNILYEKSEIESKFIQPNVFLLSPRIIIPDNIVLDGKKNISRINLDLDQSIAGDVRIALNWLKELHTNGHNWDIFDSKLRPNMNNKKDYPWHNAKTILAKQQNELTQYLGISNSDSINILKKRLTMDDHIQTIQNPKKRKLIEGIQKMNSDSDDDKMIFNLTSDMKLEIKKCLNKMNFYVDFEFISGCELNFEPNFRSHLYLIGMGYEVDKKFMFESFIVNCLNDFNEKMIINHWISRMRIIASNKNCQDYQIIHWTNAEPNLFNKLKDNLNIRGMLKWYDLHKLLKENNIMFKKMQGFGLKNVAKSMKKLGHIESDWDDDLTNGMAANMIIIRGIQANIPKFIEFPGIDKLIHYNKIDCITLWEIVNFIRLQI